jgi:hypothetical protein
MNSEHGRLKTFTSWPVKFVSHKDIVNAGFYYHNSVRCAFCEIVIIKWKKGDGPMTKHLKRSPSCRFVRDNIVNNRNRCNEMNCLCECEGDICRSPPYNRHCNIMKK